MSEKQDAITFYEGKHYYLSNFSSFMVEIDGVIYPTSEHAYQAAKFEGQDKITAAVLDARSAHDSKMVAKRFSGNIRLDWDEVKIDVMEKICRAKMDQHPYVKRKLMTTGDFELIESSHKDAFWGWGPNKDGRNELGKVWMRIREVERSAR